jgi:hypothetical protein
MRILSQTWRRELKCSLQLAKKFSRALASFRICSLRFAKKFRKNSEIFALVLTTTKSLCFRPNLDPRAPDHPETSHQENSATRHLPSQNDAETVQNSTPAAQKDSRPESASGGQKTSPSPYLRTGAT